MIHECFALILQLNWPWVVLGIGWGIMFLERIMEAGKMIEKIRGYLNIIISLVLYIILIESLLYCL